MRLLPAWFVDSGCNVHNMVFHRRSGETRSQSPHDLITCSFTQLVVNNYQEERVIYNVVAKLYGAIEPGTTSIALCLVLC